MQHSTQLPEIPKLENFNHFAWHCALQEDGHEVLTLAKIEGGLPAFPNHFLPPTYALEFVVKGTIRGTINQRPVELLPGTCAFYLADTVLGTPEISEDCEIYILGFTTQFADMLNIHFPQTQFAQLLIKPFWHLTEIQMNIVLKYCDLLCILIEAKKTNEVVHLVRSLLYNLAEDYEMIHLQQTSLLTRSEQICGEYLSLIERYCREQHRVEWYADKMHLSPKYLSNVVKQTLHTSSNAFIDRAITRQAKSLLSSTSLSVQEISYRLGFQNQSHFGTFFKRQTGFSPSAFKNTLYK